MSYQLPFFSLSCKWLSLYISSILLSLCICHTHKLSSQLTFLTALSHVFRLILSAVCGVFACASRLSGAIYLKGVVLSAFLLTNAFFFFLRELRVVKYKSDVTFELSTCLFSFSNTSHRSKSLVNLLPLKARRRRPLSNIQLTARSRLKMALWMSASL